ncbi:MAG: Fe-S cluster assembly protein SufD [Gammaproteobacteria bacterium RIFCSPHIGHO2_12_FULL_37_14]|nr:MAG: Fe-S cluster assembly protein SufD [Gammaproteobacteria bacterium RIFCSPHIGHO2_12_FULL_37_14]
MSEASNALPAWLTDSLQTLPDDQAQSWLVDFRIQQRQIVLQRGLPTRRDERWRQTDISALTQQAFNFAQPQDQLPCQWTQQARLVDSDSIFLLFINGCFIPQRSDIRLLPMGAIACSIKDAIQHHAELVQAHWHHDLSVQHHPFAGLNASLFSDGLFLYLPPQCQLSVPVHIVYLTNHQQNVMMHPRNLIILDDNTKLTIIEEYTHAQSARNWTNSFTTIFVGKQALLDHHKLYKEDTACHTATTWVEQRQDSRCHFYHVASQAQFARDDLLVSLKEKNAECNTRGFYGLTRDNQSITHYVEIDHQAPQCKSDMLYKGVLCNQSRAAFIGKVLVQQAAQKTQAHQANHHLLLTPDAEASARPELEIYADDVRCKHGATVGQLDADALFYLCSRGVRRQEAIGLLLSGFAEEVFAGVSHSAIAQQVKTLCCLINPQI